MILTLTPIRHDTALSLRRTGDRLDLNDRTLDFSDIAEGAARDAAGYRCDWLIGEVRRDGGVLHLSLILPHGANAPEQTLFPGPVTVVGDGPVALPPHDATPDEITEDEAPLPADDLPTDAQPVSAPPVSG